MRDLKEIKQSIIHTDYQKAFLTDKTVNYMVQRGMPYQEIIGVLAKQKSEYMERLMELEAIAPRKYRLPDGKIMIWRCPDELIPITDMDNNPTEQVETP